MSTTREIVRIISYTSGNYPNPKTVAIEDGPALTDEQIVNLVLDHLGIARDQASRTQPQALNNIIIWLKRPHRVGLHINISRPLPIPLLTSP